MPGPDGRVDTRERDLAGVEAGLDALGTRTGRTTRPAPLGRVVARSVLPPVVAVLVVLAAWQAVVSARLRPSYLLPGPADVWRSLADLWYDGTLFAIVWQSVSRGAFGFLASVVVGSLLGLVIARVRLVRAAIGPILLGLQSLPSVAWVPAAIIWFGLNDATIYAVILLGAVPSIANGLLAGVDQIPPLYLRAGQMLGATGLARIRHVVLPAAFPGYLSGLKQGWAFAWRSLMAAELIASSPDLGLGLGQLLDNARTNADMPGVLATILLILAVGVGIDLAVFTPIERRMLRVRGLTATGR